MDLPPATSFVSLTKLAVFFIDIHRSLLGWLWDRHKFKMESVLLFFVSTWAPTLEGFLQYLMAHFFMSFCRADGVFFLWSCFQDLVFPFGKQEEVPFIFLTFLFLCSFAILLFFSFVFLFEVSIFKLDLSKQTFKSIEQYYIMFVKGKNLQT